jgi:hypothetical protein
MVRDRTFPENGVWGDLVCGTCRLVLNSIAAEVEGIYQFTKVAELGGRIKDKHYPKKKQSGDDSPKETQ